MCLIVASKFGFDSLPDEVVARVHAENPDGLGLMHAAAGKLEVWRGLACLDEAIARIRKAPRGVPAVLHFRKATVGRVSAENAHPHWVLESELAAVHNGTLADWDRGGERSDTVEFVENWLSPALRESPEGLGCARLQRALAEQAGDSRFVLLDRTSQWLIVNEAMGVWKDGLWFSKDPVRYQG